MKKLFLLLFFISVAFIGRSQTTFNYTGAPQFYVVPGCVDSVMVDVMGAEGGHGPVGCSSGTYQLGGKGGRVQATIPVTTGDTLFIYVGGKGADDNLSSAAGGYNGGGNANDDSQYSYYGGGGGGGGSDIRLNDTTLNDRIAVAGGGGGAGADGCNCNDLYGGDGGGLTGGDGMIGALCICDPSGLGGTQLAGGTKGDWACTCDAQNGSLGQGGMSNSTSCGGPTGGGGGGGGYYGGGGGGLGGGGGGSSYIMPTASNATHTQGYQTGNGSVVITPLNGLTLSVNVIPNDSVCAGTMVTLSGSGADTYTWNNGVQNGVPFAATVSTLYIMTGTNTAQGCSDTVHLPLYVYPTFTVTLSLPGTDTLCFDHAPVNLSGGFPGGGVFSGNGVSGSSFDPQNASLNAWNIISYAVTDDNSCTVTAQDSVFVSACTGIENIVSGSMQLSVYPNPSDGWFTIETTEPADVMVYNVLGKLVWQQHLSGGTNILDMEKQAAGIYTLKFIGNAVQVMKVVKN